jgi:hypothetical protein
LGYNRTVTAERKCKKAVKTIFRNLQVKAH